METRVQIPPEASAREGVTLPMPAPTDGDVAVVKPYYLKEEAYTMGYDEFDDLTLAPDEEADLDGFTDTARYANHILPDLRAMAGFADGGHGTYQQGRQVAAIEPGCEEDEPAEADLTTAQEIFNELVDAWRQGAYDAIEGRERDPDNA